MSRTVAFAFALLAAAVSIAAEPPAKVPPVAAKSVSYPAGTLDETAKRLTEQTGIAIDLSAVDGKRAVAAFARGDFWTATDVLAEQTQCRVAVVGAKVKLVPLAAGAKAPPAYHDGPFRVAVRKVVARRDYETAVAEYEITLDVAWEPRFPVFLIDVEPRAATATAGGKPAAVVTGSGKATPTGYSQQVTVRLRDIPRGAKTIDSLKGSLAVTCAEKMLAVEFKDLTGTQPVVQQVEGVTVTLRPVKRTEKRTEVGFDLRYPPSHPKFESFQQWAWTAHNRVTLIAPDNRGTHESNPDDSNAAESGAGAGIAYTFPAAGPRAVPVGDLKGWRAVYRTPSPLVEQAFAFELKDIDLP